MLRTVLRIKFSPLGVAALVFAGALALRLAAVPPALGTMDEVHFADALVRYDLRAQSPHFPGYPVYVALTRVGAAVGLSQTDALAWPGVVLSSLGAALLAFAAMRERSRGAGVVAGIVAAAAPLAVVVGSAPSSDATGIGLVSIGIALAIEAARTRHVMIAIAAGACLGLLAGARLSHLPMLLGAALWLVRAAPSMARPYVAGVAAALVAWLVPFVAVVGVETLVEIVPAFVLGHATEWGRGAIAGESAGDASLWLKWIGLGLVLPALVLLWPARAAAERDRSLLSLALFAGLPYALWMVLGQNPSHARHAAPLVVPLALAASAWAALIERPRLLAGATVLAACALVVAIPTGRQEPAAAALARYLALHESPEKLQVFGASEVAVVLHYAPGFRAARPASNSELRAATRKLVEARVRVLATSAVSGDGPIVARFDAPHPFGGEPLVLYALDKELLFVEFAGAPGERLR